MRQDLLHALRALIRRPIFCLAAMATLALGVSANTAVFSFVNALLIRPLPLPNRDRLVTVSESNTRQGLRMQMVTPGDFLEWRRRSQVFEHFAGYVFRDFSLTDGAQPEGVFGLLVSAGFFQVLGVDAAHGRVLLPEEEEPGRNRVAVISHGLWTRHYGADPGLVGRTISVDGIPHILAGVMPPGFEFPFSGVEMWTPLTLSVAERTDHREHFIVTAGRLKPGIAFDRARADLGLVAAALEREYPLTNAGRGVIVARLAAQGSDIAGPFLLLMQAAALLVLLIACVNLASLQLVQAVGRRREIALRTALGAARWRIVRLLFAESVLLATAGAVVGVPLAAWGMRLLQSSVPAETTRFIAGWSRISLDWHVMIFGLLTAVLSAAAVGFSAAWQASRADVTDALKEGEHGSSSAGAMRLRKSLVTVEIVLAVVIVTAAGQTVHGFRAMLASYQRFSPDDILTFRISLLRRDYTDGAQMARFYDEALRSLASLPGVVAAATVSNVPGGLRYNFSGGFRVQGFSPPPGQEMTADVQYVSPTFFDVLRVPLEGGRPFADRDRRDTPPVAIVSHSFATRAWQHAPDALGKQIGLISERPVSPWRTVAGVVPDIRHHWFERVAKPTVYLPYAQSPRRQMYILLRSSSDPSGLLPAVRSELRRLDANIPLFDPKPMSQVIRESLAAMVLAARIMAMFGTIALFLSIIGVYGVTAYTVAQRRHEFGIRLAIGALPSSVLMLVVRQAMTLASIGILLGMAGGFAVTTGLTSLLYGLSSSSVAILTGVPGLIAVAALLASFVPALGATRVDPIKALRHE